MALPKTKKPPSLRLNGFYHILLVQQAGCFLPDLFLAAYAAGHESENMPGDLMSFLAAYAAGHC
ncbi:hypothetical protein AB4402_07935 [Vibrio breoganii]|uniref:hypothetical protein n=1 Tax=Vibrio breoganii TaxID=553239 RepID=UPI001300025C|nr:hypothetical protein [Vibrio breoganii]